MKINNENLYQILFVGHIYPNNLEDSILEQTIPPIQTQRFGLALLEAISLYFNKKINVLSTAPLLDYPQSKFLISPTASWVIDKEIQCNLLPFINVPILKHISRFLVTFFYTLSWSLKNYKKKKIILLHGIQSCKLWGVIFGTLIYPSVSLVPFLTDDVGISQFWENNILKKIRMIDVHLIKIGLKQIDCVLTMTQSLAMKLTPGKPFLIINAIHNRDFATISSTKATEVGKFNIVYSGGLYDYSGIELLLDAFIKSGQTDWYLYVLGKGKLEKLVEQKSKRHPNIIFLGFVFDDELSRIYELANVFVNPRPISNEYVSLSFPSKIVEYIGTGKPVVSTNLPVYDDEIKKHLILTKDDSSDSILEALIQVFSWDCEKINEWKKNAKNYVVNELSPKSQGKKIFQFLTSPLNNS